MQLKELQQAFKQHVFSGDNAVTDSIVSDKLSSEFRLSLYANAYASRLIETLEKDFPVVMTMLGEITFYELCQGYIQKCPSVFTSLRWFGKNFAEYLRETAPYREHDYLIDMARFEWLLVDAFNAADQPSIGEADIAQVPPQSWPDLSFRFHPSVHTMPYRFNIIPIWQAHKGQKQLPVPEVLPGTTACLVWRHDLKTLFRTVEEDEFRLLQAALDGATFSQLCELLIDSCDTQEQIPLRAASLLKAWISEGLIAELSY